MRVLFHYFDIACTSVHFCSCVNMFAGVAQLLSHYFHKSVLFMVPWIRSFSRLWPINPSGWFAIPCMRQYSKGWKQCIVWCMHSALLYVKINSSAICWPVLKLLALCECQDLAFFIWMSLVHVTVNTQLEKEIT
jgi:hypothetical protein